MWILILWALGDSTTFSGIEYNSESACRAAFVEIKRVNDGGSYLRGACTFSGVAENE